jgi:N-acetylneuraminate synthase/pseudaminic acid synthase
MSNIFFGDRKIGDDTPAFIIAEMSGNHGGEISKAFELIRKAKLAGADAVKVQVYTPDTITLNSNSEDFRIDRDNAWSDYKNLHELYSFAYTPWEWMPDLFAEADRNGIEIFASVFDFSSVDLMEKLGARIYKIASPEIVDINLLKYVAKTKKPVILSTGVSTLRELAEAVDTINSMGNQQIGILKCTTAYPTPPHEVNLATIPNMKEVFGGIVGLSDHTEGIGVSVAAVALGAKIIEKHLKLNDETTVDSFFSLDPYEFTSMVAEIRRVEQAIGTVEYAPTREAEKNRKGKRSLYVSADVKIGERFTDKNIKSVRPGFGLDTRFFEMVVGRKAARNLTKGDRLDWEDIGGF